MGSMLQYMVVAVVAVALLTTGMPSNAQDNPADIVNKRQQLMKTLSKSFGPIIPVLKGESDDLEAAGAAARTMHESIKELAGLFPAGTAVDEVEGSRAKQEIWSQNEDFVEAVDDLIETTANFADAINSGNMDEIRTAFQPMGSACGACHRGSADEGGKFRTPKL